MKKLIALTLILALCLVCVACSKEPQPGEPDDTANPTDPVTSSEPESPETEMAVALLLMGSINDQGWNAQAYNGLQEVEKVLGAKVSYSETVAQSDIEEVMRQYVQDGYNVIIGHGFEFSDTFARVAPEFPDAKFIVTSSNIAQAPNLGSLSTSNTEIGFLQGVAAAAFSESGIIGAVSSMEIPPVVQIMNGLKAGAAHVNPDAEVRVAMAGSYDDAGKGKEIALSLINEGADIIVGDSNQMSFGTLEACKERGVLFMGSVGDFSSIEPDVVVTSGLIDFSLAMVRTLEKIKDGTWEPVSYDYGVRDGVAYLTPYGNFEDRLTEEQKRIVEDAIKMMESPDFNINDYVEPAF
ncbi:MAG: BMP family ABC transporter substrate-binding protein [Candidatus Hydrogenedentes bacterium]|nr:BMP family ABC transporter substrate-binding protein [Candidatus Hydrogenedentota bacterium]